MSSSCVTGPLSNEHSMSSEVRVPAFKKRCHTLFMVRTQQCSLGQSACVFWFLNRSIEHERHNSLHSFDRSLGDRTDGIRKGAHPHIEFVARCDLLDETPIESLFSR